MTDKLDIPCPECSHKKKFSMDELRRNPSFVCSKCGKRVTVDGRKFARQVDKTVADAAKQIGKMFK